MDTKDRFVLALQSLVRSGGSIVDAEECAMKVDQMIVEAIIAAEDPSGEAAPTPDPDKE